jgi:hypothetical protein
MYVRFFANAHNGVSAIYSVEFCLCEREPVEYSFLQVEFENLSSYLKGQGEPHIRNTTIFASECSTVCNQQS